MMLAISLLLLFGVIAHSFGYEMLTYSSDTYVVETPQNTSHACKLFVNTTSINYFLSRLYMMHPNFIHFKLSFRRRYVPVFSNPDVFQPYHWVWTYSSATGRFPYLSWNIDHGLLSFGLLDAKTITVQFILMELQRGETNCSITIGERASTKSIINAFHNLTKAIFVNVSLEYEKHYFCYLEINSAIKQSFQYTLATYIHFPIQYLNYKCCMITYDYIKHDYVHTCYGHSMQKWTKILFGSFILGATFFLYFPIFIFELAGWLAMDERLAIEDYNNILPFGESMTSLDSSVSTHWIYLDGSAPLTVFSLLGSIKTPLINRYPLLLSRIRRLLFLVGMLIVIGIELLMYKDGIGFMYKITISDLVKHGTPVGFLSLLANNDDAAKVFVPFLGGPFYVVLAYFILGVILVVIPKSVKHIVEIGLPVNREGSPLFFGTREIMEMALVREEIEFGYKKACALFKCSLYMIFRKVFWTRVFTIQAKRFGFIKSASNSRAVACICCILIFPFLMALCILEIVTCLLLYGFPFFSFVTILIKGISKSFLGMRCKNRLLQRLLHNNVFAAVSVALISVVFVYFGYTACLIFLESLTFIARVIIYCFVAMIMYPSVAFGYLFFCVVLVYYLLRLIHDFGDTYLELLSITVEKSLDLEHHLNYVTIFDDVLIVSNVKTTNLRGISVNNKLLNVPQNCLQDLTNTTRCKVKQKDNMNGIPKTLFDQIVDKHRPVHIQFLKLLFHLILIIVLVTSTLSIMYKFAKTPTSELSDVMHVIFIVTVGALPRVLEVALNNESEVVKREIEGKNIEQSILEYWRDQD